ncbi:hypothetical protein [Rhodoblastus sp.]|uniref:hypothetical protein n=1 Tax=Rhodoblastus sp. TaxID=1962975 RepID=UPI003F9AE017
MQKIPTPLPSLMKQYSPHLRRAATLITGVPLAFLGIVASFLTAWDAWLQTFPLVQPPSVSPMLDQLPFVVTNPSHFFVMHSITPECFVMAAINIGELHNTGADIHFASFDLPPQQSRAFECSLPYFKIRDNFAKNIDQITSATAIITFSFETHLIFTLRRKTDPIAFFWQKSLGGQYMWTPIDPRSVMWGVPGDEKPYLSNH